MSNRVLIKRGLSTNLSNAGVVDGELKYATDKNNLFIGNGTSNIEIGTLGKLRLYKEMKGVDVKAVLEAKGVSSFLWSINNLMQDVTPLFELDSSKKYAFFSSVYFSFCYNFTINSTGLLDILLGYWEQTFCYHNQFLFSSTGAKSKFVYSDKNLKFLGISNNEKPVYIGSRVIVSEGLAYSFTSASINGYQDAYLFAVEV